MARTLDDVISGLGTERRQRIDGRFRELKAEVEGLADLRRLAGKAQTEVAAALNIKQPSVSKIEKQSDLYLSTLKNYVEAIGGTLEIVVSLPSRPPLRVLSFSDLSGGAENPQPSRNRARTVGRARGRVRREIT